MPRSLLDTLCVLKIHPEGLYVPEIHALSADRKFVKITAVNNRLTSLEQHGMVTREREGKNFRWKVKPSKLGRQAEEGS